MSALPPKADIPGAAKSAGKLTTTASQRLNSSHTRWVVGCYLAGWVRVYRPGMRSSR